VVFCPLFTQSPEQQSWSPLQAMPLGLHWHFAVCELQPPGAQHSLPSGQAPPVATQQRPMFVPSWSQIWFGTPAQQ
jgi:hypothetical protein